MLLFKKNLYPIHIYYWYSFIKNIRNYINSKCVFPTFLFITNPLFPWTKPKKQQVLLLVHGRYQTSNIYYLNISDVNICAPNQPPPNPLYTLSHHTNERYVYIHKHSCVGALIRSARRHAFIHRTSVKHISRGRRVGLSDLIDIFDEAPEKRRASSSFLSGAAVRRHHIVLNIPKRVKDFLLSCEKHTKEQRAEISTNLYVRRAQTSTRRLRVAWWMGQSVIKQPYVT